MLIERVRQATPELVDALARLIPQLTENDPPPRAEELEALLKCDSNILVTARWPDLHGAIVGVGSLALHRVPTGIRAIIENVVVNRGSRRRGIAEALMQALLTWARQMGGARSVAYIESASGGGQSPLPADGFLTPQHQLLLLRIQRAVERRGCWLLS